MMDYIFLDIFFFRYIFFQIYFFSDIFFFRYIFFQIYFFSVFLIFSHIFSNIFINCFWLLIYYFYNDFFVKFSFNLIINRIIKLNKFVKNSYLIYLSISGIASISNPLETSTIFLTNLISLYDDGTK